MGHIHIIACVRDYVMRYGTYHIVAILVVVGALCLWMISIGNIVEQQYFLCLMFFLSFLEHS